MYKYILASCLVALMTLSCKNDSQRNKGQEDFQDDEIIDGSRGERVSPTSIQTELQGVWKRVDYPYSRYEFKEDTAKLISEGQAEEPQFDAYELSENCRYADESYTELEDDELILISPKYEACEILSIRQDTLRIEDLDRSYEIIYTRQ